MDDLIAVICVLNLNLNWLRFANLLNSISKSDVVNNIRLQFRSWSRLDCAIAKRFLFCEFISLWCKLNRTYILV